jgi:hypothetical protein
MQVSQRTNEFSPLVAALTGKLKVLSSDEVENYVRRIENDLPFIGIQNERSRLQTIDTHSAFR